MLWYVSGHREEQSVVESDNDLSFIFKDLNRAYFS